MSVQKIKENIFFVGAQDWDRTLFDAFIPLPNGTSYNAYLIKGNKKTALIDTVDPTKTETLFRNLEAIGVKHIDYIISNHAEQDHSGSIPMVLERFANAQLVTGKKGQDMLLPLLNIPEKRIRIVEDGRIYHWATKPWNLFSLPGFIGRKLCLPILKRIKYYSAAIYSALIWLPASYMHQRIPRRFRKQKGTMPRL